MTGVKRLKKLGCLGVMLLGVVALLPALAIVDNDVNNSASSPTTVPVGAIAGIPQRMMAAYTRAAAAMPQMVPACKGMTWSLLAGIGKVESDHANGHQIAANGLISPPIIGPILDGSGAGGNTSAIPDTDGGRWDGNTLFDAAVGPMQFLPSTFAGYAARVRPGGGATPNNADDETLAAALYLCGNGRNLGDPGQLNSAILSYNHSSAYVDEVLRWKRQYEQLGASGAIGGASEKAQRVIAAARSQLGVPYSWGGGGPDGKSTGICCSKGGQDGRTVVGFDCSGLMQYAFAQVGVMLPRVAEDQAQVGQRIPASAGVGALQPGDMVFFGNSGGIYHVGLYIGGGQMLNAPKPGDVVKQAAVWNYDYAGGARVLT
ncbi:NlpC/P60 family protein [Kitasatospora sp. NPDC093679]|uniref:C40 family peptidase n=1 Tax=Kitasatospora sp. NPDC093679 TaxID=3154983 RepID=UPI00341B1333